MLSGQCSAFSGRQTQPLAQRSASSDFLRARNEKQRATARRVRRAAGERTLLPLASSTNDFVLVNTQPSRVRKFWILAAYFPGRRHSQSAPRRRPEKMIARQIKIQTASANFPRGMNERLHFFSARHASRLFCPLRASHRVSLVSEMLPYAPHFLRLLFACLRLFVYGLRGRERIFCVRDAFSPANFSRRNMPVFSRYTRKK